MNPEIENPVDMKMGAMEPNNHKRPRTLDDVNPSKSELFWFNLFWAAWGIGGALCALLYLIILLLCPLKS